MIVKKKFPAKVACVHCNGGCRAKQSPEGYDLCTYGCTGCGTCASGCPKDAITIERNLASIDYSKCDNCGMCATVCPKHLIKDSKVETLADPVVKSINGPEIKV